MTIVTAPIIGSNNDDHMLILIRLSDDCTMIVIFSEYEFGQMSSRLMPAVQGPML